MLCLLGTGLRFGGAGVPKGARTVLSRHNFHRTYQAALAKLADPTGELRPTAAASSRRSEQAAPKPLTNSPPHSPTMAGPSGQPPSRSPWPN